ncbi:hypothetical protein HN803_01185 [candidate division WWE3 bacterium]|jgi:hypothetical protein|nr:hypothetical protein [candidate division WWE3 bacterium]MBT7349386.1 hypothetical protein [candidate division WWE3 bacterium]
MKVTYVAHKSDTKGMVALRKLKALGYPIRILTGRHPVVNHTDVALFTAKSGVTIFGSSGKWLCTLLGAFNTIPCAGDKN